MIAHLPEKELSSRERRLIAMFRAISTEHQDFIFKMTESTMARCAPPVNALVLYFKGAEPKPKRGRPIKKGATNA